MEQLKKACSKTTKSFLNDIATTMSSIEFYTARMNEYLEKAPGMARFGPQVVTWRKVVQELESKEVELSDMASLSQVMVAYLPVKDALRPGATKTLEASLWQIVDGLLPVLKKCNDVEKLKGGMELLSAASGVWESLETELFTLDALLKEVKCKASVAEFRKEGQSLVEMLKLGSVSTDDILATCKALRLKLAVGSDLCVVLFYHKTDHQALCEQMAEHLLAFWAARIPECSKEVEDVRQVVERCCQLLQQQKYTTCMDHLVHHNILYECDAMNRERFAPEDVESSEESLGIAGAYRRAILQCENTLGEMGKLGIMETDLGKSMEIADEPMEAYKAWFKTACAGVQKAHLSKLQAAKQAAEKLALGTQDGSSWSTKFKGKTVEDLVTFGRSTILKMDATKLLAAINVLEEARSKLKLVRDMPWKNKGTHSP